MMTEPRRVDACSLPLQATLYLHAWYVPLFLAMEMGCLAFKGKPTSLLSGASRKWWRRWEFYLPFLHSNECARAQFWFSPTRPRATLGRNWPSCSRWVQ